MAESFVPVNAPKRTHNAGKRVGHIKMEIVHDLKASTSRFGGRYLPLSS